jgi:hypothetical protein
MSTHPTFIARRSRERGVALILTLAILALVTLLLIAFVTSMRVENMASGNYNSLVAARELARGAVDQAVAQIRQATPQRGTNANPGVVVNYVTFPGGAYVSKNGPGTLYPLYSGPTATLANQTNLNAGLWITGGTSLGEFLPTNNATANQINVGWLYVTQDGTITVGPGPGSGHGAITGRIAYWVDDEASKININTAGSPSNAVDMSVLLNGLGGLAGNIVSARLLNPFTTIEEIKRANVAITNMFDDNRCEVTVYSNDANYPNYADDLDVFDRQRMLITSLNSTPNIATLNITGQGDVNGVGAFTRLSDQNLGYVCAGGSILNGFQGKYGGASGLSQLIANIIGYQIDPSQTWPPDDGSGIPSAPAYLGLAKTPLVNSVKIEYDITPAVLPAQPATVTRIVSVQLCYMYNGTYTNGNESIIITGLPVGNPKTFSPTVTISPADAKGIQAGGTFAPNGVAVFSHQDAPIQFNSPVTVSTPGAQVTYTRTYGAAAHRLNYAQTGLITAASQPTLDPGVQAITKVYQGSDVIGDPAVNVLATGAEWQLDKTSSFPSAPSPDPKTLLMRGAAMQSVGELGCIHLPASSANPQWGYLTLQHGGGGGVIPDWALLDLFTIGAGTGGRININSLINPGLSPAVPAQPRLVPLDALLSSVAAGAAGNIYSDSRADAYGMQQSANVGIFDTIGEICEIPSLATGGSDAAKEAAIRGIASLITVRSSTFTIWVLAQSIKQPPGSALGTFNPPPTGLDQITGEVRAQAVVERYENPPGSAPKYRLRYFRYL